jgi:hypothetical protein
MKAWSAEGYYPMYKERSEKIHCSDTTVSSRFKYSNLTLSLKCPLWSQEDKKVGIV